MSAVDDEYLNWARCVKSNRIDLTSIQCDRLYLSGDVRVAIYCFGEVTPKGSRSWGAKPDFSRSNRPSLPDEHNKLMHLYTGQLNDQPLPR